MKNKHNGFGFSIIVATIAAVSVFLFASEKHFNLKEIDALTSQCYENDGLPSLTVHNEYTNNYAFQCE